MQKHIAMKVCEELFSVSSLLLHEKTVILLLAGEIKTEMSTVKGKEWSLQMIWFLNPYGKMP